MKKYIVSIVTIIILVGLHFYMNPNPKKVIENHLKNKYNEEFVVELLGKRNKTYEAIIYPQKYVGTPKENDSYYWGRGFAKGRNGGDTYGLVLLNESTNEFFLPKLKELFGENVLPVFDMGPGYNKNNFKEELETMKKAYKEYPTANFEPISGGIYIFGRVESDEDREWYRKQIYEFVQFMKQTGTFEYVKLDFSIIDERIITNEFTPKNFQQEILTIYEKALNNEITGEEFKEKRRKILSEIKVPYNLNKNKLDEWNKGNIISIDDKLGMASTILFSKIISEKFIASNEYFYKDYPKKKYDKIEDIKLDY